MLLILLSLSMMVFCGLHAGYYIIRERSKMIPRISLNTSKLYVHGLLDYPSMSKVGLVRLFMMGVIKTGKGDSTTILAPISHVICISV